MLSWARAVGCYRRSELLDAIAGAIEIQAAVGCYRGLGLLGAIAGLGCRVQLRSRSL